MTPNGQHFDGQDRRGTGRPQFGDMTVSDYANGMPSIRLGEMFKSLLRQLVWVIPLALLSVVAAYFATKNIKRTYTGEGSISVQVGDEYIYDSVTGGSGGGNVMMTPDSITLNETAIMKSPEVMQAVRTKIEENNLQQYFAPEIYAKITSAKATGDEAALRKAELELQMFLEKNYAVSPRPKSSVIDLSFTHVNGDMAVRVTKYFMTAYQKRRQAIFVDGTADVIGERRKATGEQIKVNEENLQAFLKRNNIASFESERAGASARSENLRVEINTLQAQMIETEAALASVENQLRAEPREINIYQDDRAGQRVAQAELELKDLLARYLPGSDPVLRKQAEIAQYKALQSSSSGAAIGGRRVGPNPVYQGLLTRRNLLQSTADSYREKEFALQRQLNAADAKVRRLQRLSPEYQAFLREQSTLDQRHTAYTAKEQEALINQRQAGVESENVKVFSEPILPRKGRNMRAIMALLIVLGSWFTLFMVALLRVFLDPKLYASRGNQRRRGSDQRSRGSDDRSYSSPPAYAPAPAYHPESYIPEAVPASPAPQAYASPEAYNPPTQAETAHYQPVPYQTQGNAAYDMHAAPAVGIPVLGTVPATEQD